MTYLTYLSIGISGLTLEINNLKRSLLVKLNTLSSYFDMIHLKIY